MTGRAECLVHGTTVAIDGGAALIRGPSGSGKSDLALRFLGLFAAAGARLVSDDQTRVERVDGRLRVSAPATIAGLIEVRGVGPVGVPHQPSAELSLIVDLTASDEVPRLPPDPRPSEMLLDCPVPVAILAPFEASAPFKLKLLLSGTL